MEIDTTRFGNRESVEVDPGAVVHFADGIPGFEQHREFAVLRHPDYAPFAWLQSFMDPGVCFVVISPLEVVADYQLDDEYSENGAPCLWCIVVVRDDDPRHMTVNLKAPILVDETGQGRQLILAHDRYALRHPLRVGEAVDPVAKV